MSLCCLTLDPTAAMSAAIGAVLPVPAVYACSAIATTHLEAKGMSQPLGMDDRRGSLAHRSGRRREAPRHRFAGATLFPLKFIACTQKSRKGPHVQNVLAPYDPGAPRSTGRRFPARAHRGLGRAE